MPTASRLPLPWAGPWADAVPDPDAALLRRFAADRDAAAFAVLVRRHGPLVFGVCLRVAGQREDAEDAFQAVFLVLAQKAGAVTNPDLLGNWLYGVAYRVAGKARRAARRRQTREAAMAHGPRPGSHSPSISTDWADAAPVIDEELSHLADHYRSAVLLCDVQGLSRSDAAARLGIAEGTLSSRLNVGRKLLAERLTRRGVTLSAVAVGGLLADHATAAVPDDLSAKLSAVLQHFTAGDPITGPVGDLTREGWTMRAKLWAGLAAVTLSLGAGASLAAWPGDDQPKADPPKAAKPDDPKADAKPGDKPARPKLLETVDFSGAVRRMKWTADGKQLWVTNDRGQYWTAFPFDPKKLTVELKQAVGLPGGNGSVVGFSEDGQRVYSFEERGGRIHAANRLSTLSVNRGAATPLSVDSTVNIDPDDGRPVAVNPDGKTAYLLTTKGVQSTSAGQSRFNSNGRLYRAKVQAFDVGKGEVTRVVADLLDGDEALFRHAFSRDAARLYLGVIADKKVHLRCLDTATGEPLWEQPLGFPAGWATAGEHALLESHDGRTVCFVVASPASGPASGSAAVARRYHAATGKPLAADDKAVTLDGLFKSDLEQRTYATDGRLFAGAVEERTGPVSRQSLRVWDLTDGKVLKEWECDDPPAVGFVPARPVLAIAERVRGGGNDDPGKTILGFWDLSPLLK